jgi:uroporphyrinogen decarboxylase
MCEFIADFSVTVLARALREVRLDWFLWWEDFSFKTGPLISPAIFREFLFPRYRRCNDALLAAGVDVIFLDTDGNPTVLLPLLLEAGVNGTYPMEAAAGMDPLALRREFGRDLLLWGGVDKRTLTRGEAEIRKELLRKLPPLLDDGGYIPQLDHLAPPDIPYRNWLYYLECKQRLLEGDTRL